jgi:hypothetical protein
MLYVRRESEGLTTHHVGEPLYKGSLSQVIEVQADGDELLHITQRFTNLPMTNGRVVRWFGDHARFIVANW